MRRLEKKYGKKKGREMAESQYKNFLERHQQEEYEEVQRQEEVSKRSKHSCLCLLPSSIPCVHVSKSRSLYKPIR